MTVVPTIDTILILFYFVATHGIGSWPVATFYVRWHPTKV